MEAAAKYVRKRKEKSSKIDVAVLLLFVHMHTFLLLDLYSCLPRLSFSSLLPIVFCLVRNAHAIALFLESQMQGGESSSSVTKVVYPGLASHPQHELAKQHQHGFGAMITFYCTGGRREAAFFLKAVRTIHMTLVQQSRFLAHVLIFLHCACAPI
jgi:Cys/Met metabolism PLP-dependent enzyme